MLSKNLSIKRMLINYQEKKIYYNELISKINLIPKKYGKFFILLFLLNMLIFFSLKSMEKIPLMMTRQKLMIALGTFHVN